jgi:tetratricopeptide (TPR) repeat protein
MKALRALLLAVLLTAGSLFAASPAANQWMQEGDEDFYNLDYDQAVTSYEKAVAGSPDDPVFHNHLAQALLYREMFRDGALESELVSGNNSFLRRPKLEPPPDVEKRFFSEIDRSMQLSQARIAKNPQDTAALHALSVSLALRANYGFLVRKSWRASLYDSSQARKYDNEVTAIDPGDYDARLLQGGYDYIVGNLTWTLRALGFIAGYHGDKQRGIRTIEEVAAKGRENRVDAEIVLCALYRREGQPTRAIPLVSRLIQRYPRNYLLRFELAQMYASIGERKSALDTLGEIAKMKQDNVPGYERVPWEKIYYETGNLEFWFDDLDKALENLKKVTATPEQLKELDLNTGVLALMRQGQIYDLQNRHNLAILAYREAVRFAPEAEAARESQHYINSPYTRSSRGSERG